MSESPQGSTQPPSEPTWERLEDQIGWYAKSIAAQRRYKQLKVLQLLAAAAATCCAADNDKHIAHPGRGEAVHPRR